MKILFLVGLNTNGIIPKTFIMLLARYVGFVQKFVDEQQFEFLTLKNFSQRRYIWDVQSTTRNTEGREMTDCCEACPSDCRSSGARQTREAAVERGSRQTQ